MMVNEGWTNVGFHLGTVDIINGIWVLYHIYIIYIYILPGSSWEMRKIALVDKLMDILPWYGYS